MRVAVLSVTRDRLSYTQHCFERLRELAGCPYDHYVFDNGSQDGTQEWLEERADDFTVLGLSPTNEGLSQGFNNLLDELTTVYDVIVKMDNDLEMTVPNTLKRVCELAHQGYLLSPKILGLNAPPSVIGHIEIDGEPIEQVPNIGGIFMAAPAAVYDDFRPHENAPTYGYEDVELSSWWRRTGGVTGYLTNYPAWHYERVDEQHDLFPEYQERKVSELRAIGVL